MSEITRYSSMDGKPLEGGQFVTYQDHVEALTLVRHESEARIKELEEEKAIGMHRWEYHLKRGQQLEAALREIKNLVPGGIAKGSAAPFTDQVFLRQIYLKADNALAPKDGAV
jgi:hypothetical protein